MIISHIPTPTYAELLKLLIFFDFFDCQLQVFWEGDDRSSSSKFIMRLVGILLLTKNLGRLSSFFLPPLTRSREIEQKGI